MSGVRLLREPAFARLCLASFLSESAEWMLQVALPVLVFQATGSASLTAAGMVLGLLPAVLLSPLAGVLADRWDRRLLLCGTAVAQLLVALPLLAAAGNLPIVYAVMAGQAASAAVFEPARNALVPDLLGPDRVVPGNGLIGVGASVARLTGAWAGGVLLAAGGLPAVLAGYGGALALSVALLAPRFARAPVVAQPAPAGSAWRQWLDGLAEFRRDRTLRVAGAVLLVMSVAQGMFLVLFVLFVLRGIGGDEADVGLLRGVQAIGGIAAGVALATVARRTAPPVLLGTGTVLVGLVSLLIWHTPAFTSATSVYVVLFALVGAPAVLSMAGLTGVLQNATEPRMTGRVLGTAFAGVAAGTATGMLAAGALADRAGLPVLLTAQALLYVLAGLLALFGLVLRVSVRLRAPLTGTG
ncbi:MFS transporter [Amycolatopsis antarctica]|uniref:MFS transporter n=1 Tax=Amycolatopsis antarctica TaxID=1854586 RepID=A0A263D445_9PSEU|nr:MFS transporter [Amycolatopsis antarctica]OZM72979.1 MFS transporter [Amycolatopsis antarctica]